MALNFKHKEVFHTQDSPFMKLVEGIAICPFSDRIYVATGLKNYLLALSPTGDLLFKVKTDSPWGICFLNSIVCVSDYINNSISLMTLNGELITTFVKNLSDYPRNISISHPTRLNADLNDNLYICDSHRLLRVYSDMPLITEIGLGILHRPEDVHIWQNTIYVLDWNTPCIAIFSLEGEFLKRIITKGPTRFEDVDNVYCFNMDTCGNLILSDFGNDSLAIFSSDGCPYSKIGKRGEGRGNFDFPMGIAINSNSQIVSVCRRKRQCIQFF